MYKKKQEIQSKRPKSYKEQEEETREKGLNTAISAGNKGFQLLTKMGFQPGTSLGKSQKGLTEPINIVVKGDAAGVGREKYVKTVKQQRQQNKELNMEKRAKAFRAANAEKHSTWVFRRDFYKAQCVCEELDSRHGVEEPVDTYFWTKDTMKKLRQKNLKQEGKTESSDDSDEDSEDEGYDDLITEENQCKLIDYLRSQYKYCMYCAFTATSNEDLEANCPGPYKSDHDLEEL